MRREIILPAAGTAPATPATGIVPAAAPVAGTAVAGIAVAGTAAPKNVSMKQIVNA
jgi:hypothetical protein